jgi:membrane dipeptidase
MMEQWYKKSPVEIFERELATILSQMEKNSSKIRQAYSAADVRKNAEAGRMSGILTVEGPAGFGFDPALLEDLYAVGFRMTTLGWNENNVLAGSHKTGGGLTELGAEYLKEAQRLGMIVDVSHISDEAFWDMIKITEKPIIASHSNSRAVCDVSRNLTDDMFRAIMETGGVAGLNLYTDFIGENADLDKACDHVLHWLELDPDGRHIALGGDLDGCEALPAGFEGVQSYPALAKQLAQRGVDDQLLRKIFWENALGVMETCCM